MTPFSFIWLVLVGKIYGQEYYTGKLEISWLMLVMKVIDIDGLHVHTRQTEQYDLAFPLCNGRSHKTID